MRLDRLRVSARLRRTRRVHLSPCDPRPQSLPSRISVHACTELSIYRKRDLLRDIFERLDVSAAAMLCVCFGLFIVVS